MSKLQSLRQDVRRLCAELRAIKNAPAFDGCQAFRDALRRGLDDAIAADVKRTPGPFDFRETLPKPTA
jgi:hypothetical protein